jgi:hypothetical protein
VSAGPSRILRPGLERTLHPCIGFPATESREERDSANRGHAA